MQEKHECKCPHCGYEGDDFTNGIILDPFCGTGTTLLRAYELDRKVIGIEGNKDYHKIAETSLNNMLNQLKIF